jgi:hypothetical protein
LASSMIRVCQWSSPQSSAAKGARSFSPWA